jgi:hypothetical protein
MHGPFHDGARTMSRRCTGHVTTMHGPFNDDARTMSRRCTGHDDDTQTMSRRCTDHFTTMHGPCHDDARTMSRRCTDQYTSNNYCLSQANERRLFVCEKYCLSTHGMSVIKLKTRTLWQQLGK